MRKDGLFTVTHLSDSRCQPNRSMHHATLLSLKRQAAFAERFIFIHNALRLCFTTRSRMVALATELRVAAAIVAQLVGGACRRGAK